MSSSTMMKKNRIRICGRKTSTLPTPAIRPSAIRLCSRPSGRTVATPGAQGREAGLDRRPSAASAQVNTAWNITNSRANRISRPPTGCSSTASTLPVDGVGALGRADVGLEDPLGLAVGGADLGGVGLAPGRCRRAVAQIARASALATRSSRPRLRVATVVTIGAPISADSRSRSMRRPWRWAMSYMLSASTNGRPTCFSSRTRRSTRRRLVASATQISTSGAVLAGQAAQHRVAGDAPRRGCGPAGNRCRAGRARAGRARRAGQHAFLPLDGDAGVVGDLLAAAGQGVEQGGLAGIGIADQRQTRGPKRRRRSRRPASSNWTVTAAASRRRRATRMSSMRDGDRVAPEQPSCSTSMHGPLRRSPSPADGAPAPRDRSTPTVPSRRRPAR